MTKNRVLSTLLAVSIAFVLWVYVITVVSPNSEVTIYNIPVVVQGEPMLESYGLMNVTENIPSVTLKLSGNRSDLNKVNSSNITVVVDLSKVDSMIAMPLNVQSQPAKRWVLFQFTSLFSVQGILMPMV